MNLKRLKSITTKRAAIFTGVVLILALAVFWLLKPQPTLIDLQKEIMTAKTKEDTLRILKKLDEYYLNMPIPESILQEVEDSVEAFIIQRFDPSKFTQEKLDSAWVNLDSNIYVVENQLHDLLPNAMIARKLKDMNTFQIIMAHAEQLADTVDTGTENNYWQARVAKVKEFDVGKAGDWLLADQAEKLCYQHHLSDFGKAEKFGGLGFQLLQQIEDERLLLDITQRFVVILFQYRGMYDLSFPLAERAIQKADEINYRLRATGLTFNYAVALRLAGYNNQALNKYLKTIERIITIRELSNMDYYEITTQLDIARVYQLLGKYDKSLSICSETEKLPLDNYYKHVLHNTRGITYIDMGKYDLAESEYNKALNYAIADKNPRNQILILSNIGKLYFRLTEYDKANAFYQDAMSLLLKYYPENFEERSRNLIRLAELEAAQNEKARFNNIMQEARKYIVLINNPRVKGRYLVSLGQLNMEAQNYQQAHNYFSQAIMHYESVGMIKDALETKTALIKSLIELNNYEEAKKQLNDQFNLASELHDAPTQIDAIGLSSHIAYKEGKIDRAIQKSNQLINKVEELSSQISDLDILTTFRQKINPYLKDAVLSELRQGWADSAFVKLDYLKAREAKHRLRQNDGKSDFNSQVFINIDSLMAQLKEKQILINYMVTEDTLYTFALYQDGLHLFKKAIHIDELRRLGNDYIEVINNSRKYLDPYQLVAFQANYDSVLSLGRGLYKILLDWPELRTRLQHTNITYIIPDDILYGIPFSCLNDSDGSQFQFLIQKTAIVNLPSAAFLQSFQSVTLTQNLRKKRVLICADQEEFPKAEELVKYIKHKFPRAEELIIDNPIIKNEDVLKKLNEGFDIYFLIGHSIPNLKFPDLSNLQLTPLRKSDKMPFRVELSLSDLKRIDWSHTEMVFLIGCETAIGKLYEGSGFSGFQQNLLTRGAKAVMASSWKIDNIMTFRQVEKFLDTWNSNKDPAIALQNVEMEWIQQLQEDAFYNKPHPFLWKILSLSQTTRYN